jgi:hypothetical protein
MPMIEPDAGRRRLGDPAGQLPWRRRNPDARDSDGDALATACDNCPATTNPGQQDLDRDRVGDACDPDLDGDNVLNPGDNCLTVANPGQQNLDGDRLGDACDGDRDGDGRANGADNCPSASNAGQQDLDRDRVGDACDPDRDGDGLLNGADVCPSAYGFKPRGCPTPPVVRFKTPLAGTGIGPARRSSSKWLMIAARRRFPFSMTTARSASCAERRTSAPGSPPAPTSAAPRWLRARSTPTTTVRSPSCASA